MEPSGGGGDPPAERRASGRPGRRPRSRVGPPHGCRSGAGGSEPRVLCARHCRGSCSGRAQTALENDCSCHRHSPPSFLSDRTKAGMSRERGAAPLPGSGAAKRGVTHRRLQSRGRQCVLRPVPPARVGVGAGRRGVPGPSLLARGQCRALGRGARAPSRPCYAGFGLFSSKTHRPLRFVGRFGDVLTMSSHLRNVPFPSHKSRGKRGAAHVAFRCSLS